MSTAGRDGSQQGPYDFDVSLFLIAMSGFAFFLTFFLVLHLYLRCILRRHAAGRHGPSMLILSDVSGRPTSGLDPAALAAIPSFPYAQRPGVGSAECAVCLSEVQDGEVVREIPACSHLFHVGCIDMWLRSHATCPVCRVEAFVAVDVVPAPPAVVVGPDCGEASVSRPPGLGGSLGRVLSGEDSAGRSPEAA